MFAETVENMGYFTFNVCASGGIELVPRKKIKLNLKDFVKHLPKAVTVKMVTDVIIVAKFHNARVSIYPSGRALVAECDDRCEAIAYEFSEILENAMKNKGMISLFVGRFQPFHKGHLLALKEIAKESDEIVIVIAGPGEPNNENPFTFKEREEMIKRTMDGEGIRNYRIHRVKDVNNDRRWAERIKSLGRFDIAYTQNEWTERCLRLVGIPVKHHKFYNRDKYSGTEIRRRIIEGEDWKDLVPPKVYEYIKERKLDERLRSLP